MSYRPEGLVRAEDEPVPPNEPALGGTPTAWGPRAWLRWTWRQLTSMRVALLLLLLLAVAALPGSFVPQRPQDPVRVAQYYADHPSLAPLLDRWGFFDVYAAPWFAAIYLLLFVSLVGCIVPRAFEHVRALRRPPPRAPRRFTHLPVHDALVSPLEPAEAEQTVRRSLRGYRVRCETSGEARVGAPAGRSAVVTFSSERGYLREAGNITFHLALVGLLVSVAYGSLVHHRGQVLLVEGDTFANSRLAYDSFDAGAWFEEGSLDPFRMRLDSFGFRVDDLGRAVDFAAEVTLTEPGTEPTSGTIRVNHPLRAGGASVYLMGNGYAPRLEVHDSDGALVFAGAVPFIPQDDATYASRGVVKVPDTTTGTQIGLNGWFLPTGVVGEDGSAFSLSPEARDPVLVLDTWSGDLGLDDGVPQNVYQLDTSGLTQSTIEVEGKTEPARVVVRPGESVELPDGLGTLTFVGLPRFVGLDLRYDPTLGWVLGFALLALAGLAASLFLPRRRVFVRLGEAPGPSGGTLVTAGALARGDDPGLARDLQRVLEPLRSIAPASGADPGAGADPPSANPGSSA